MTRLSAALAALKNRIARLIGGPQPVTFTQSCERCKAVHPSNGLHLVRKV